MLAIFDMFYAGTAAADTVRFNAPRHARGSCKPATGKIDTARTGAMTTSIADFLAFQGPRWAAGTAPRRI